MAVAEVPVRGLGIPAGGGLVYHPDGVVEPVRRPIHELVVQDDGLHRSLLLPGEETGDGHDSTDQTH
jgi:hypothetical protein